MTYFLLAIGLILSILLSFAIYGLWLKYANTKIIKIFLLPGTVVHELSHALLCLATGTTIKELNLFSSKSSGIKYDKPRIPGIFDFVITAAPIFGCAAFIIFLPKIFSNPVHFNTSYPQEFHSTLNGVVSSIQHLYDTVLTNFIALKEQLRINNIHHILFLLAIIIFTVSMAPQKQDIKYLIIGFVILPAIFFLLEKFGVHLSDNRWWGFCIKELWITTTITLSVLIPLLGITLMIMALAKVYTLALGSKGSGKSTGKGTQKSTGKGSSKGDND